MCVAKPFAYSVPCLRMALSAALLGLLSPRAAVGDQEGSPGFLRQFPHSSSISRLSIVSFLSALMRRCFSISVSNSTCLWYRR